MRDRAARVALLAGITLMTGLPRGAAQPVLNHSPGSYPELLWDFSYGMVTEGIPRGFSRAKDFAGEVIDYTQDAVADLGPSRERVDYTLHSLTGRSLGPRMPQMPTPLPRPDLPGWTLAPYQGPPRFLVPPASGVPFEPTLDKPPFLNGGGEGNCAGLDCTIAQYLHAWKPGQERLMDAARDDPAMQTEIKRHARRWFPTQKQLWDQVGTPAQNFETLQQRLTESPHNLAEIFFYPDRGGGHAMLLYGRGEATRLVHPNGTVYDGYVFDASGDSNLHSYDPNTGAPVSHTDFKLGYVPRGGADGKGGWTFLGDTTPGTRQYQLLNAYQEGDWLDKPFAVVSPRWGPDQNWIYRPGTMTWNTAEDADENWPSRVYADRIDEGTGLPRVLDDGLPTGTDPYGSAPGLREPVY